ncbi:MAG: hypothetical protein HC875_30990 [Anaerolineales bacterium]|nr:hypothetical protein [Anaerolineales bacterium]
MLAKIELLDLAPVLPGRTQEPENWYTEPFTKRTGCKTPGQCGGDCNCGCPYNTMTEVERLPLIEDIARIFPNEWLAFIISPAEDEEFEPLHGKLIAHSLNPDEVYDAANAVLWNQHLYIYFNGSFETMQASYGLGWTESTPVARRMHSGPQPAPAEPLPEELGRLVTSALDQLYQTPRINEAIRRLRLARVRAAQQSQPALMAALDTALDKLERPLPFVDEVIWQLEEALVELEIV